MAVIVRTRVQGRPAAGIRRPYVLASLVLGGAIAALVFAAAAVVHDRVLPGVSVAGVDVAGLSATELRGRLDRELAGPWAASALTVTGPDGRTWTTTNAAIGLRPDVDRAAADAFAYGRRGSAPQRLAAWIAAVRGQAAVPFALRADGPAADAWLAALAAEIDRPARAGAIRVGAAGIEIEDAVVGRAVDRAATLGALLGASELGDRTVPLAVRETYPAIDPSGLRDGAARARAAVVPLTLTAGDGSVHEDAIALATLLTIARATPSSGELEPLPAGAVAPDGRDVYRVRLDEARARTWIAAVAAALDRPARNAGYRLGEDGSLAVVPAVDGVRIDRSKLLAQLSSWLFTPAAGPRSLAAPLVPDLPAFTTEQAQRFAAGMVRVATFTTSYPANAARHANITTGAAQFDGLVIAPGQTFSFWDLLGPVTVERGYSYAGAIIDGRSDENVIGGGLCQVSTTLFNAVARAGYEIVERNAHGYYIDRYPMGFDAAVFQPGVDFRWRNDTAAPVLIRAYGYAASVQFDLFSVPTGRRVVVGEPAQWNLRSPAPDQPADPAYPPGAVVQGRDVVRTRTVYEGDRVIHEDVFFSHYVPVWGGPAR